MPAVSVPRGGIREPNREPNSRIDSIATTNTGRHGRAVMLPVVKTLVYDHGGSCLRRRGGRIRLLRAAAALTARDGLPGQRLRLHGRW